MRPATRIGREVIFPGGLTGRLRVEAYLLIVLGLRAEVRAERDLVGGMVFLAGERIK